MRGDRIFGRRTEDERGLADGDEETLREGGERFGICVKVKGKFEQRLNGGLVLGECGLMKDGDPFVENQAKELGEGGVCRGREVGNVLFTKGAGDIFVDEGR